jgi:hypothetical protein
MYDKIEIVEGRFLRSEKISWNSSGRSVKHRGQLSEADRLAGEVPSGAASLNNVLEAIASHLISAEWLKSAQAIFCN